MDLAGFLKDVGVSGLVDVSLMALVIYGVLVWLKRTQRAARVLTGILIVALVYLLARQFGLQLTAVVLQGFFAVFLVALVVIFQEELRYFFERVAQWGLGRRRGLSKGGRSAAVPSLPALLAGTIDDLALDRVGALIVLRGVDPLSRHLEGGETLDGELSEAILKSLFDPHSIGHDGAVIIEGARIHRFGCHLPLSRNTEQLRSLGTRHAAALGLSERTDALCIVVSEERGRVSVARHGNIDSPGSAAELERMLAAFLEEVLPATGRAGWRELVTRNLREKMIALLLAAALWFVLVHEARIVYRTFRVPVELAHLPAKLRIIELEPAEIEVTLSAPRRSMYFVKPASIGLALRAWDVEPGTSRIEVSEADLTLPLRVVLENVKPRVVEVIVEERPPPASTGP